ncbi:hypothetical protein AB0J86_34060 [Micromonospora sp. NPDC049559]|uniref:hypothetical protein n=1 Tax=Micromonospora sp. NPDC049559 TaxID=3155923 RepID=UPI00343AE376
MTSSTELTITCPDCVGLTFTLVQCTCVSGGDRLVVDFDLGDPDGKPYRDCLVCQGTGTVARACTRCEQRGRRRAQLVLTVANLDTGTVASRNVVPGSLEPVPAPDGGWRLVLTPVVRDLAAAVGAETITDIWDARRPLKEQFAPLPSWRPDLPAERRYAIEAEAITRQDFYPWRLYLGRVRAQQPFDPDRALGWLCAVADLLCLDLMVEARHEPWGDLSWDVRYEVAGGPVPANPSHRARDLPEAVATTTVQDALDGLGRRGLAASAYAIGPASPERQWPPVIDLDQVERRVHADARDALYAAGGAAGAQAIWRDGRWWHTRLRPGDTTEVLAERSTGQIVSRRVTSLARNWEPPASVRRGDPIPYTVCPDCDPDSRLRRCLCTLGGRPVDADCASCAGTGLAASTLPCPTCRDSHRIYSALTVTVTDLRSRVVHQLWRPQPGEPAELVATQPGGRPVYRLAERYRLDRWAAIFGVPSGELTEADGGHEVGQDLREGVVTASGPGADPVIEYVASAGRGQPGARFIVVAAPPEVPPLPVLIRLALGLRLAVVVTIEDHRLDADDPRKLHGQRWQVEIVPPEPSGPLPGQPDQRGTSEQPDRLDPPVCPTLAAAIGHCLRYLGNALVDAVPTEPDQPIEVPQLPVPVAVTDPTPLIERLGAHYPGRPVAIRFDAGGCHVRLGERDGVRPLARARTLAAAVTALGLTSS